MREHGNLKNSARFFWGLKSRAVPAPVPRHPSDVPAESACEPIRNPSKIEDMMDFSLSHHSPNKQWSVWFWDRGHDASNEKQRTVRLPDNTTGQIAPAVDSLQHPFSVDVSDVGIFAVDDAGLATDFSAKLVVFDTVDERVATPPFPESWPQIFHGEQ